MVRIRLARHGTKKRPYYRIVAAHGERARDGKFLEILGTYDPRVETNQVNLKEDRVRYWLENGAQPSTTVKELFKKNLPATIVSPPPPAVEESIPVST